MKSPRFPAAVGPMQLELERRKDGSMMVQVWRDQNGGETIVLSFALAPETAKAVGDWMGKGRRR